MAFRAKTRGVVFLQRTFDRGALGTGNQNITLENIGPALEHFLLTQVSFAAKFDRGFELHSPSPGSLIEFPKTCELMLELVSERSCSG